MRFGMAATKWATIALAVPLLLAACGEAPAGAPGGSGSRDDHGCGTFQRAHRFDGATAGPLDLEQPPPVTVRFFDESVALEAWTYCYRSVCADGAPPAEPSDVGNPGEVVVEFPLAGWSFRAAFRPAGDECGRSGLWIFQYWRD
jgi:hypothetical protein